MDVRSFYKRKQEEESSSSVNSSSSASVSGRPSCSKVPKMQCPKRQLDPNTVWRVFPRQQMAFDFAKTCWQSVAVFAFESEELGCQGQRRYLVTTYHLFSHKYLAMEPPRHFYEVLTESAVCRLYFDIEYNIGMNPDTGAAIVLETFIEYVCYQLSVSFGLTCDRSHILDLDSSTETKFSRHLIFHLPNAVFTNNLHIGNWVHYICDMLRRLKSTSEEHSEAWKTIFIPTTLPCPSAERLLGLFVSTEKSGTTLICDEGVYTRNRNFRLFLSSKLGKTSCLRLARGNKFKSERTKGVRPRNSQMISLFMDTLVCKVSYKSTPRILSYDSPESNQRRIRQKTQPHSDHCEEGYSASPYPQVDSFVTGCVRQGGVQGVIRRWSYFQQERLMVYDIKHNRWCENIQRAHKSNNIMIIADLQRGVYYQKCHDPTCRSSNFKSNEYLIPVEVNPLAPGRAFPSSGSETAVSTDLYSEWLGPGSISLEDLQDYSLEDTESSSGVCGSDSPEIYAVRLDDEAILARVASEMDFDLPDVAGPLQAGQTATEGSTLGLESSKTPSNSDINEDLLFDTAYDLYEANVKIS